MQNALILSVGGSPEPVSRAIEAHSPGYICFLVSQQTVASLGTIARIKPGDYETEIIDDPEDILGCYTKALSCFDRAEKKGYRADHRIIDVTGGTKAMTAALAIALAARGGSFSYVGGTVRDKGGVGVVQTGYERLRDAVNPFQRFAVEQKRQIAQYFNSYQFAAAASAVRALPAETEPTDRALLDSVGIAADGYAFWDRFQHREAAAKLKVAEQGLALQVGILSEPRYEWVRSFHQGVNATLADIQSLQEKTNNFAKLHSLLAADLAANARRRIEEGKFDDAVARLYRAFELLAQCRFEVVFGCPTGKVSAAVLPDEIRTEFENKYRDERDGYLQLPLYASYRALAVNGDPLGKKFISDFESDESRSKALLSARNQSVLAHGMTSVTSSTAEGFLALVSDFLPQGGEPKPFPRLRFD